MWIVETNEGSCSVGGGIMQHLPVVERGRNILAVVEEDILLIVVDISELEDATCASVHGDVMSKTKNMSCQHKVSALK